MQVLPSIADAFLALAAVPVLLSAGYLLLLTAFSGRGIPPRSTAEHRLKFDLVVPAHDEEAGIARTVRSLLALDWPAGLFRVIVVADNCTDGTARAAARAGAQVMVREDEALRGKGYALAMAFGRSLTDRFADAVVVVDADSVVEPGLLASFASRLERGALAVQADYAVRNPDDGPRTRLMSLAFTLFHRVRSLGRERLGLSCGLRGNGMCFATPLLREVPYAAFSRVEDVEYGLRLGEAGHRVFYADEARVLGEMVTSAQDSASQRRRWEEGRRDLRARARALLRRALGRRDRVLADLAVDVLVPPLARLAALSVAGALASSALWLASGRPPTLSLGAWALSLVFLAAYVARGVWISGSVLRTLAALAFAPAYLAWKVALRFSRSNEHGWVRTARQGVVR